MESPSSDCHLWKHGEIGDVSVLTECGAGHESAGEVIGLGPGVTDFSVGDRVALEVGLPCGECEYCLSGRYNGCPKMVFHSAPPLHGTLTRYHAQPKEWCHRLPDNTSFEEGALCEPLAVALAGIDRSGLRLGDQLLIWYGTLLHSSFASVGGQSTDSSFDVSGAGPIGLVSLLAAQAAGAAPIIITDMVQSRLDYAKKLVPRVRTLRISKEDSPKQIAEKVQQLAGQKMQVTLECTGVDGSIHSASLVRCLPSKRRSGCRVC